MIWSIRTNIGRLFMSFSDLVVVDSEIVWKLLGTYSLRLHVCSPTIQHERFVTIDG